MTTFNVLEYDVSDDWGKDSPSSDPGFFGTDELAAAETRSYTELAGGSIKVQLICDPTELVDLNDLEQVSLTLVAHIVGDYLEEPSEDGGFYEGTLLGQVIHDNGCSGWGYTGCNLPVAQVAKLPILRTVEAEDAWEAANLVREEDGYDPETHPDGIYFC
jgi:hypothetical protein